MVWFTLFLSATLAEMREPATASTDIAHGFYSAVTGDQGDRQGPINDQQIWSANIYSITSTHLDASMGSTAKIKTLYIRSNGHCPVYRTHN